PHCPYIAYTAKAQTLNCAWPGHLAYGRFSAPALRFGGMCPPPTTGLIILLPPWTCQILSVLLRGPIRSSNTLVCSRLGHLSSFQSNSPEAILWNTSSVVI